MKRIFMVLSALISLWPALAAAQPAQNPSQGPMTIERLHSGFAYAADVKVTDFDRQTGLLVGGRAGWVVDDALFMGGGVYWLTNGDNGRDMVYGGFMIGYTAHATERVGFGVRAMLGGGDATLPYTYTVASYPPGLPRNLQTSLNDAARNAPTLRPVTAWYSEGFFIAEPEATVSLKVARQVRLVGGVGYRFTSTYYGGINNDRLGGVTGTVSVQVF